jgi:very-short-patch-repair endonuclease
VGVVQMARRRSDESDVDERAWALRDRTLVSANRIRARAMRAAPTDAEKKLWWHLRYRLRVEGTHFRRQVRLGRYIVDFACHNARLVIEIDGGQHAERSVADARRSTFLESEGYRVLRYWNNDVLRNVDGVLEDILSAITTTPTPNPSPQGGGEHTEPAAPANSPSRGG